MVGTKSERRGTIAAYDAAQSKVEGAVCRRLRAWDTSEVRRARARAGR